MEQETRKEQSRKKGRQRKKGLYNAIRQQMEFYFSDSNLSKDRFLSKLISENPFVDLDVFLNFNKIRQLTTNVEDLRKSLASSEFLELSPDETKVKRKTQFKVKTNIDQCTIYVEHIKADTTHEWLTSAFSKFGKVAYVSLPKYSHNKFNKGFAFIEFDDEKGVSEALEYFKQIGQIIQVPPEELCSIKTFEAEDNRQTGKEGESECGEENVKKRKIDDDDDDDDDMNGNEEKKLKIEEVEIKKEEENDCNDESDLKVEEKEADDKGETIKPESKRRRKNKKCPLQEMGLQILKKSDWKKLRNKYLNMQREKMKQLKQYLNRNKYSQQYYEENNSKNNEQEKEQEVQKLQFTPNVIVKVLLTEPCSEPKKLKTDLNNLVPNIMYVDSKIGSNEIFIRFSEEESAINFLNSKYNGECVLLQGNEEKEYWDKIQKDRDSKMNKDKKKLRGRDKLLKRAEKQLAKHVKFEDAD